MRKLRGLWKIVFGRTTMLVLLLFIQALVLFGGFVILGRQVLMLNYMSGFLAVMILMYILNVNRGNHSINYVAVYMKLSGQRFLQ